jgi:ABC-type multidrug transport system permease subunit
MRVHCINFGRWVIGLLSAIVNVIAIGLILLVAILVYLMDWLWNDGP